VTAEVRAGVMREGVRTGVRASVMRKGVRAGGLE